MATFGIIAEGVTDQAILENILYGYFGDRDEEPVINAVQPPRDATGQSREPPQGGWGLVFKSLEAGAHRKALQFNDFVVIQIDTDVSQEKGFDVPWRDGGRDLSVEELVERTIKRLKDSMGHDFCAEHGDRLIFAVAVHQIECWLLPLFDSNKADKITGCLAAVNHELGKRGKRPLASREGEKFPRSYQEASREYAKRRVLMKSYPRNPSLKIFIERLEALAVGVQGSAESPPAAAPTPPEGDPPAGTS